MKTKTNICLILTGLLLFIFLADISAQINDWNDVVNHAVLDHGVEGEWDDRQVWNPAVIRDGDTLRMYYTGGYAIVWDLPMTKIGYAWSLDGVIWTRYNGNPVLSAEFNWEDDGLFGCAVIKDGDTMKMWYGCGDPGSVIGYATSLDGKKWNKYPSPVLETGPGSEWDDYVIRPTTVVKEDDMLKMYYWGGRPYFPYEESMPQIGLATSPDGINWTKYNDTTTAAAPYAFSDPVLKHGETGDWDEDRAIYPMVLKKGSGYEMLYTGAKFGPPQKIGYAQSEDGINWVKHLEPVFPSSISWGDTPYGGTFLNFDEKYHLWYACFHTEIQAGPKIGYASSPNPAGIGSLQTGLNIQVYPNPAGNKLNITAKGFNIDQVVIYTLTGQQVFYTRPVYSSIDISHLQPGMYIVEVTIEGRKVREKLIVER
jgi:predicted GH43/DUF377 family glycosyl hydrolase